MSGTTQLSGPTLLRHADIAMYRAKESGPAHVELYSEDDHHIARSRLRTSTDLRNALAHHELELYYQPCVDLRTRLMVGMQSLVRWHHPTRGLLLPDEFISMAEDSGLIVPLGTWALEETCRQAAAWTVARGGADMEADRLNISVDVSALQLADPGFPDLVAGILDATGLDPERLWLECTESALMRDAEGAVDVLHALRATGVHLGIGTFGSGYSSLAYLKRYPVEFLKIDNSFVRQVDRRAEDTAVVRAIIGLGDSLGVLVIAGGVERWDQVARLQGLGCHLAQGQLLGPALPTSEIGAFPTDDLAAWHGLAPTS